MPDLVEDLGYATGVASVNIHDAKTHFSRLIERVLLGEEIVIAKAGRPVAKLVPITPDAKDRRAGTAKGAFVVPPDFDEPLPDDILAEWG
jgi:prevent-host-death family protein